MTDARRWMEHGTQLFLSGVTGLDDAGVAAPSGLPGWGRRHLLAHVAANAEALRNLVHWAETGEETPMYASSDARARGIEEGSQCRRPLCSRGRGPRPRSSTLQWRHSPTSSGHS